MALRHLTTKAQGLAPAGSRGYKVAVLGAAGGIGKPTSGCLSALLRRFGAAAAPSSARLPAPRAPR